MGLSGKRLRERDEPRGVSDSKTGFVQFEGKSCFGEERRMGMKEKRQHE